MKETLRVIPENWLGPLELDRMWPDSTAPLRVDLGFGMGRFLLNHAARHPECRILGIEHKLRRVRKMDGKLVRAGLRHVRLLRVEGYYATRHLLPPASVDVFFIYFPDPWPKKRHHGNRIFSPDFVDALHRVVKADGVVHFATDHGPYADEVIALVAGDARFAPREIYEPTDEERSDFELKWMHERPTRRYSFGPA